ncbi:hypothetical protein QWZ10_14610 [Paracoccus cavernae]|uniref:Uncharacterized protein n=1 Tax=Paracoccus cavernae TaxID=1571207 RepID=A0ABT8D838_9RHOB|nr:hypothetical protein [Paracoccus cavernae]
MDELRRVGFGLCAVSVSVGDAPFDGRDAPAETLADIRIDFRPEGALSPRLLLERIARMPGVRDIRDGPSAA